MMKAMGIIFANIYDSSLGELTNKRTIASLPYGGRYRPLAYIQMRLWWEHAAVWNRSEIPTFSLHWSSC